MRVSLHSSAKHWGRWGLSREGPVTEGRGLRRVAVVWEEGRWNGGGFRRGGGRKGWRRTKPLCGHPGEVIGRLAGQRGEGEVICAGSASDSCERREGRERRRRAGAVHCCGATFAGSLLEKRKALLTGTNACFQRSLGAWTGAVRDTFGGGMAACGCRRSQRVQGQACGRILGNP